jgi:hypothetical protein
MIRATFRLLGVLRHRDFPTDDVEAATLDFIDWWIDHDVPVTSAVLLYKVDANQLKKEFAQSVTLI